MNEDERVPSELPLAPIKGLEEGEEFIVEAMGASEAIDRSFGERGGPIVEDIGLRDR